MMIVQVGLDMSAWYVNVSHRLTLLLSFLRIVSLPRSNAQSQAQVN